MKRFFVSTLTAIALALPLGISGLTLTASPAEAFIQALKHHFETCSTAVIHQCDGSIRTRVFTNPTWSALFTSRAFPHGSNGVDQRAWDHLNNLRQQRGNLLSGNAERVWRELVSQRADWDFYGGPVYVWERQREMERQAREEAERQRLEAERAALEAERLRAENERRTLDRFRNDCTNHDGRLTFEDEAHLCSVRLGYGDSGEIVFKVTEYTGYDAENPDVYTRWIRSDTVDRETQFRDYCINDRGGDVIESHFTGRSIACAITRHETTVTGRHEHTYSYIQTYYLDELPVSGAFAFQISEVAPLESLADIEEIAEHRQVTSDNRSTIVTIVEEFNALEERVLAHNDRIAENSFLIEAVADRLVDLDDRAKKNTAGIALGYALGTPGLLADKRFAFGGGVGSFEGENAVAFTLTGRITDSIIANVGGGMAGSGDTGVNGFKGTISFQW